MSKEQIEDRVIELVRQYTHGDVPVEPDTRLREDLGLDSLDTVELKMDLEDEYSTAISDEEFLRMSDVGDVIDFIEKIAPGN